jgi:hypothetical protein
MSKKKPETIRTTITVTRDLKRQMDVTHGVNWSHVAREAFRAKLAEVAANQEEVSMNEVLKRLRESKRAYECKTDQRYAQGFEAGREWASRRAEAFELENLYRSFTRDWERGFQELESVTHPAEELFDVIGPRCTSAEFWERAFTGDSKRLTDSRFMHGFTDGAIAVWEEFKDQI